jgi:hypothetical protein
VTALRPVSPSEHVLGIVCGQPNAHLRWLLMLKAYIDDSRMRQPPFYVLGGWFAPVSVWMKFSDAWRDALWMKPRIEYFKYSEAVNFTDQFHGFSEQSRNEKVRLLVSLIEDYELEGIVSIIPHYLFYPMFGTHQDSWVRNPYFFSFYGLVARLTAWLSQTNSSEKIEFIFDYQPGGNSMQEAQKGWEDFRNHAPPQFLRYVQSHPPSFLDDKDVVALQAADLSAGWPRERVEALNRTGQEPVPFWYPQGDKIK